MYNKIFCNNGNSICYKISHSAALAYTYLIYQANETGLATSVYGGLNCALNIGHKEMDTLLDELCGANLIEVFYEPIIIAEIGNGSFIWDKTLHVQILNYQFPDKIERLPTQDWNVLRRQVFERDNYTCQYCKKRGGNLECDHVIPIHKGGTNELGNLITACPTCNRSKRSKLLSEWERKIA